MARMEEVEANRRSEEASASKFSTTTAVGLKAVPPPPPPPNRQLNPEMQAKVDKLQAKIEFNMSMLQMLEKDPDPDAAALMKKKALSAEIDSYQEQIRDMKPPAGLPKTWPKPWGSVRGPGMAANMVSEVPSEITTWPGSVAPMPTSEEGLSPVEMTTLQVVARPYFSAK